MIVKNVPEISDWEILRFGQVVGTIRKHPTIEDGDTITTSALEEDYRNGGLNKIVRTKSGSKYKLIGNGIKKSDSDSSRKKKNSASNSDPQSKKKNASLISNRKSVLGEIKHMEVELDGKTVGDGKYLIAGNPYRSTSGRSKIYSGYKADKNGLPSGNLLALKIGTNYEGLERESDNYNRVTFGIFNGCFVNKLDFLRVADEQYFKTQSALVIEGGVMNLEQIISQRSNVGFDGRVMRDIAAAAGQCVQAMHSSFMVWTDLKIDNFVVMEQPDGTEGIKIKGIDLESAVPFGKNPVDYSPEACPPEFAKEFISGNGGEFIVRSSYDMWSLGMMLYHVSTGMPYFSTKSPVAITRVLGTDSFSVDLSRVNDLKLRDLLQQCLNTNPKKRPDITRFLLHPYFITTGIGPWSLIK